MTIGIYKIENKENHNTYIGQSKDIERRWRTHREDLSNNIHHQKNLQKEYNKYIKELKQEYKNDINVKYFNYDLMVIDKYYSFIIIENLDKYNLNELLKLEDNYILKFREIQKGYNQLTNEEIKDNNIDILDYLNKMRKLYPKFFNYKTEDRLNELKLIQDQYLSNKINLNKLTKLSVEVGIKYSKEYIERYGEPKEGE